jgi:hypothetical protein
MLFVLVVLLVAGCRRQQRSNRVEMLAFARDVPVGQVITTEDLRFMEVRGSTTLSPRVKAQAVAGTTAAVRLVEGQGSPRT